MPDQDTTTSSRRNVQVVLSPHLMRALDEVRGSTTRQDYIRCMLGEHLDVPVVSRHMKRAA
jgi:hypothetical protein